MKRQLPLALAVAFLSLACVSAWASDGEITITALDLATDTGKPLQECDYWVAKHRGNTDGHHFGSCQLPLEGLKVYANLMGASAGGITGVEFSVNYGADGGADPGWQVVFENFFVSNPTNFLGTAWAPIDPGLRGLNLSWNVCQTGAEDGVDDGRVLLEQIIIIPTGGCGPSIKPPGLTVQVGQHSAPGNVLFRCPLFTLCDGPVFTKVCLGTNIVSCQTQVPPFPNASLCSTSGEFAFQPQHKGTCANPPKAGVDGYAHQIENDKTWSNVKSLYR
jgi:hypothetical protein